MSTTDVQAPAERFNFAQHLLAINAQRPNKTAFIDDHGSITYAEVADRVRRVAAGLRALGLRREERVLLLMHDGADWPVSFLGAMYAGLVPVAVNTLLTADDYAYMLENSRAQAALVSGALLPALSAAMVKSEHEVKKVIVSHPIAPLHDSEADFEAFIQKAEPMAQPAATGADDPGFWLYSSGSTGRPKGTVHSHANPYWTAELYGKRLLGITEQDVCFSAAKLFFAYGLGNGLSFPMSVGATTILMAERPTPDATFARWLGKIGGVKPTVFFGAPKRCRPNSASASRNTSASRSSMASARPRCCTSSCRTNPATCATAPPAGQCRATRSSCAVKMARRWPTVSRVTSTSTARAPR
jgi:benzoate-CoA ligase